AGSIKDGNGVLGLNLSNGGGLTFTLTGNNTYTGPTSLTGISGILQIGSGGTSGSITSDVNLNVGNTLRFNRSDDVTYGGKLSGAGRLQQNGAATLTLSGDNSGFTGTATINSGTLSVSADNNLGGASASLTIGNGSLQTTSTFSSNRTITLSAAGSGIDVAAGTLTLNG